MTTHLITPDDRNELLMIASWITTLADDEHLIVDHARTLEEWVSAVADRDAVDRRMCAVRQVFHNLRRLDKLPMDRPEELIRRAVTFHAYQDSARPETHAGKEPVAYLDAGDFLIEAVNID